MTGHLAQTYRFVSGRVTGRRQGGQGGEGHGSESSWQWSSVRTFGPGFRLTTRMLNPDLSPGFSPRLSALKRSPRGRPVARAACFIRRAAALPRQLSRLTDLSRLWALFSAAPWDPFPLVAAGVMPMREERPWDWAVAAPAAAEAQRPLGEWG